MMVDDIGVISWFEPEERGGGDDTHFKKKKRKKKRSGLTFVVVW